LPSNFKFDSVKSAELGVAKSRNTVLRSAQTKYLLFADDEIVFLDRGIKLAVAYLEEHPECDLVLAQAIDTTGALRKRYSKKKVQLTKLCALTVSNQRMCTSMKNLVQVLAITLAMNTFLLPI
jgi:predicted ATPase